MWQSTWKSTNVSTEDFTADLQSFPVDIKACCLVSHYIKCFQEGSGYLVPMKEEKSLCILRCMRRRGKLVLLQTTGQTDCQSLLAKNLGRECMEFTLAGILLHWLNSMEMPPPHSRISGTLS